MMEEPRRILLAAVGRHWMLPLYDPFVTRLRGDAVRVADPKEVSRRSTLFGRVAVHPGLSHPLS